MRMPWGKYQGRELDDIPSGYLCWVLDECNNVSGTLARAIKQVLIDRYNPFPERTHQPPPPPFKGPRPIRCLRCNAVSEALWAWHRRWCLELHPDRGGDARAMAALTECRDELQKLLTFSQTPE